MFMNPFEVREVLQVYEVIMNLLKYCLNPFEVREVLQAIQLRKGEGEVVSIPLKSGRCCKKDGCIFGQVGSQSQSL